MAKIKDKPNEAMINSPPATQAMFGQLRAMLAQAKNKNGELKYTQARIDEIIGEAPDGRTRMEIAQALLKGL
jgi:hypothetical protein